MNTKIIAINKNKEKIIPKYANKIETYFCILCGREVIYIEEGNGHCSYFKHKIHEGNCETFEKDNDDNVEFSSNNKSPWHSEWQNQFKEDEQEVVKTIEITKYDYDKYTNMHHFRNHNYADVFKFKTPLEDVIDNLNHEIDNYITDSKIRLLIKHRADVSIGNISIEFQHSPISVSDFNNRNWFYTYNNNQNNKFLFWVFDVRDKRIIQNENNSYVWKKPPHYLKNFKYNNVFIFLQIEDDKILVVDLSKNALNTNSIICSREITRKEFISDVNDFSLQGVNKDIIEMLLYVCLK